MPATRLAERVIARLAQAEVLESNPHYRDDLRIARLTVAYAASGEALLCSPHVLASYMVLGLHPEKVWPAIEARRKMLCGRESDAPPKKPAQSVKLWAEKRSAAKVSGHRGADSNDLRDQTISVPMAAPSIAALFPNSDQSSSAKKRQFMLEEMKLIVWRSYAPDWLRIVTLAALEARGEWPNEKGPASSVLSVALRGIQIESANAPKRTTQHRIKRACDLKYWRKLRGDNTWSNCPKCGKARESRKCGGCNYVGRVRDDNGRYTGEFSRPAVYEFNLEKFLTAPPRCREIHSVDWRTYSEYKAAAKRGEHPNLLPMRKPAQPDSPPKPPAPAAPVRSKPAAETDEPRKPLDITRDVRIAIAGCYSNARKQGKDEAAAIRETCEALSSDTRYLSESEARLQLKIWQSKNGSLESVKPEFVPPSKCEKCGSDLVQNRGPGPRLKCPRCTSSP